VSDEERARLKRHIGQADDLATQARSLGLSDEADAIDSAVREYQDAWRRVEIAPGVQVAVPLHGSCFRQ
jgi:hypothetical protein